jgi:AcrR family transcriptional regulator
MITPGPTAPPATPAQKLNSSVIVRAVREALRAGEDVTMRGIAHALGVSAPALYRHVGNLENLLQLVVVSIDEDLARSINASVHESGPRRTSGNLAEAVSQVRLWAVRNPREFDLLLHGTRSGTGGPTLADLVTVRLLFELGPDISAPAWSTLFGALVLEVRGHADSCGLADGSLVADAVDGLAGFWGRRLGQRTEQVAQP